jgi:hypothetical protein
MKRSFAIATLVATTLAVVLVAPSAYAQNANSSITVSPTVVEAGGTVHISGSVSTQMCPAVDAVTVTGLSTLFPPDGFGPTAPRDAQGAFAVRYTVPAGTPAGRYDITLRCGGANPGVSAVLTVSKPSAPVQPVAGGTGHGVVLWTGVVVACLLVAGMMFMLGRRAARHAS